jgi:hypothetical protein
MEEVIQASFLQAMRAAVAVAALAEMEVLLRPTEAPVVLGEEVLVEMGELSPFRLMTHSAVVVAEVEAWDPAPPQARIWGMEVRTRTSAPLEMEMVSQLPPALEEAVILEEAMREEAEEGALYQLLEAAVAEARGWMECSLKALQHQELALYLPEAMEEMVVEAVGAESS